MKLVLDLSKAGGPYIGPRGGKWADPKHTIAWKEGKPKAKKDPSWKEDPVALAYLTGEVESAAALEKYRRTARMELPIEKRPKPKKPGGTMDRIRTVVDEEQAQKIEGARISATTADLVLQTYNALAPKNREKFSSLPVRKMVDIARKMIKSVGGTMEGLGRYSQPGWRRPPGIAPVIARDWMDRENRHLLKLYTTMPKPKLLISDGNYRSTMDVMKGLGFSPNEEIAFAARLDRVLNSARNELHVRKAINEMMYVDRFDSSLRAEIARRVLRLYQETRPPDPIRGLVSKSRDVPLVIIL